MTWKIVVILQLLNRFQQYFQFQFSNGTHMSDHLSLLLLTSITNKIVRANVFDINICHKLLRCKKLVHFDDLYNFSCGWWIFEFLSVPTGKVVSLSITLRCFIYFWPSWNIIPTGWFMAVSFINKVSKQITRYIVFIRYIILNCSFAPIIKNPS